ncbi:MAG TPA: hypothetical protein VF186_00370 [Gaiellaceae bacterium]|jgi:hypothetical protein
MKRLLALVAGGLGLRALLRRRRARAVLSPSPADDLRAKLAAARPLDEEPEAPEAPVSDVATRRAEVHERARRAIDELDT